MKKNQTNKDKYNIPNKTIKKLRTCKIKDKTIQKLRTYKINNKTIQKLRKRNFEDTKYKITQ